MNVRQVVRIVFSVAIPALCLFGSAGRLNWVNAWVLLAINLTAIVWSTAMFARNPELLAERSNLKAGKSWDKPIVAVVALVGPVATWVTAGLDARYGWSAGMGRVAMAAGVVVAVAAVALIGWAMQTNRFFSSVVRIQKDRGHVVVSGGPYRFVRHPGYVGIMAATLATPLILDSRRAFVPAVLTAAASVLRTALEDRTLRRELSGYADYAGQVRFRLVPGIW